MVLQSISDQSELCRRTFLKVREKQEKAVKAEKALLSNYKEWIHLQMKKQSLWKIEFHIFHEFCGKAYKTPSNVRKWDFFPRTVIHKMNGLFSILEMKEDEWTLIDF